ncbi:hypothetical protein LMQ14_15400 [Mycobacterium sp. Aquia_213]|nr:hypothetical protein [Mycobacterium sp. Aquia_213]WAC89375.1 hypothetical protein LMQ14_15400 [Mycobacterium sp. Aquia_213]
MDLRLGGDGAEPTAFRQAGMPVVGVAFDVDSQHALSDAAAAGGDDVHDPEMSASLHSDTQTVVLVPVKPPSPTTSATWFGLNGIAVHVEVMIACPLETQSAHDKG